MEKGGFADVIQDLEMRSSWVRSLVSLKEEGDTQRPREEKAKRRQRLEGGSYNPRTTRHQNLERGQGGRTPGTPQMEQKGTTTVVGAGCSQICPIPKPSTPGWNHRTKAQKANVTRY